MSNLFIIYTIENTVNGKVYVGQTRDLVSRWKEHQRRALKGENGCPRLYNAMRKHGVHRFRVMPLVVYPTLEQANEAETYFIGVLKTRDENIGYNLQPGGDSRECLESTRQKLRLTSAANWRNPQYVKRIRKTYASPGYKRRRAEATIGAKNSNARLRPADVEHIRFYLENSTLCQSEIAALFGVAKSRISEIKTYKSWNISHA